MPNYKGHVVGGSLACAGLCYFLQATNPASAPTLVTLAEWYCCAIAGALFPDIDTKSKGQKYFYRCVTMIALFFLVQQRFQEVAFVSLVALAPLLVRHRGITHSIGFIALLCAVVVLFAHGYFPHYKNHIIFDVSFFFVGALSHVWLDLGLKSMVKKYK